MRLAACVLMLVVAVLQGTLLWDAAPGHVTVDGVLVVTLAAALTFGPAVGAGLGCLGGLLLGAMCGNLEGPLALVYLACGWWAAELKPARPWLRVPLVGVGASAGLLVVQYLLFNLLHPLTTCQVSATALLLPVYHTLLLWPLQALFALADRPRQKPPSGSHDTSVWRHRAKWGLD